MADKVTRLDDVRAQQSQAEFETVQAKVGELDEGETGLDDHHDRLVTALRLADERVSEIQAAERNADDDVSHPDIDCGRSWICEQGGDEWCDVG